MPTNQIKMTTVITIVSAVALLQATTAKLARGEGSVTNVALARRGVAQADFDIASAVSADHDTLYTLLAAMGLPPTAKLRVSNSSDRPLPSTTGRKTRRAQAQSEGS